MAPILRAFISYRRLDDFMRPTHGHEDGPDLTFIRKLKDALLQAGFGEVFVDTAAIHGGDQFDSRIRQGVSDCDLLVVAIGRKWLELLREKIARGEEDMLVDEIGDALRWEKEIVPLLVDETAMPRPQDLPERINKLQRFQSIPIASTDSVETIAAVLIPIFQKIARARNLHVGWRTAYIAFALFAYCVCAILTHIVGVWEYGREPWEGMVKVWSGFYVWPIICLPFALMAFYRPLTVVFEFAANAKTRRDVATYVIPLAIGLVVTALAVVVEVKGEYETPWTIHPTLPGCTSGQGEVPIRYAVLATYDQQGTLKAQYRDPPFWLRDKCWPNAFFYLIEPAFRLVGDPNYVRERPAIQQAFVAILNTKSEAPYSLSFYVYVLSFSLVIWCAATGVILAMFYVTLQIRRPHDDRVLRIPSEDAYLCLTYAFITMTVWVPFRMNTVHLKKLYFCPDLTDCQFNLENYQNDIVLGLMFLICYLYLTAGLLVKYKRLALTVLGGAAVALMAASAVAVVLFSDAIARMAESWQFYLRLSIVVCTLLFALWLQFNPDWLHRREFQQGR